MIINIDRVPIGIRPGSSNDKHEFIFEDLSVDPKGYYYVTEASSFDDIPRYLVIPYHLSFFRNIKLTDIIPEQILDDIMHGDTLLTIEVSHDAFYHFVDRVYDFIVIPYNIPANKILLVAGSTELKPYIDAKSKELGLPAINYECYYYWEKVVQRSIVRELGLDSGKSRTLIPNIKSPLELDHHPKKFLTMTRLWREHKGAALLMLKQKGLLDKGYVSFSQMGYWDEFIDNIMLVYKDQRDLLIGGCDVKNQLPLILDTNNFQSFDITYFARSMTKFYNESLFSLVNETSYEDRHPYFPTEKIFKAIFHKHPFVVSSTAYFLENLRNQGYQTFSGLIDESYDREPDHGKRLVKIIDEVERLCNMTERETDNFKKEALKIVEYNFDVLMSKRQFLFKL